ncbi:hypothetical protein PGQ11_001846 [Apiospora arundinis]|uniref:Uncharacterized protein n=1 Tax=Apiospora arundinis TaxID=335852 RepID=A0ABR2JGP1_9PEZI
MSGGQLNDDSLWVVQPPRVRCGLNGHIDSLQLMHRVIFDALPMVADSFVSYSHDHFGSEGYVFVSRAWTSLGHLEFLHVDDTHTTCMRISEG